jgi:hypothetical protein
MNNASQHQLQRVLRATEAGSTCATVLADALCAYANERSDFAAWLAGLAGASFAFDERVVAAHLARGGMRADSTIARTLATYEDTQVARKALWLCQMLGEHRMEGWQIATATFVDWARAYERDHPKAVVLGIKYGAVPVGLWGKANFKDEPMAAIVRADVRARLSEVERTKLVHRLTHEIVERGLLMAGGNTSLLEPELADWLFGEKALTLFVAEPRVFANVYGAVAESVVLFAAHVEHDEPMCIVTSPMLYLESLPEASELTLLEE